MSLSEHFENAEDLHPIDLVEHIAEHHAWEFDRIHDDQIAMAVWASGAPIPLRWRGLHMTKPCA